MMQELKLNQAQLSNILASDQAFFVYSYERLEETVTALQDQLSKVLNCDFKISFSMKSQPNFKMVQSVKDFGLSLDVASYAELKYALGLGFSKNSIALGGCGLSDAAIQLAIEEQIAAVHCDSLESLKLAQELKKRSTFEFPRITIRYQPSVLPMTKLGFFSSEVDQIVSEPLQGLHVYLGRESFSMQIFKKTLDECSGLLSKKSLFSNNPTLFLGPGLPAHLEGLLSASDGEIDFKYPLHLEFGRTIAASAGYYGAKVLSVKNNSTDQKTIIIDGGLQHLGAPWVTLKAGPTRDRPLFYNTRGEELRSDHQSTAAVYGSLCLWQDCLHPRLPVPNNIQRGDWIIMPNLGAYGLTAGVPLFIKSSLPREFIHQSGVLKEVTHHNFKTT